MCISYRGTDYDYAFGVAVQLDSKLRHFHILMTKHRVDRPYRYAGICFDDGFQVNTKKPDRYVALCDIIGKIVDSYIYAEKACAERYPGEPVKPFKNIMEEEPDIYRKFNKRNGEGSLVDRIR
jgi:hypothetical protein